LSCFPSFVSGTRLRAVKGLFVVVDGENRVGDRYAGVDRGSHDPRGGLPDNNLIVVGLAFDHGADRHHGGTTGRSEVAGGDRKFPGARHTHDSHPTHPLGLECLEASVEQAIRDRPVEVGDRYAYDEVGRIASEFDLLDDHSESSSKR
jgi:hypothetical protein